MQLNKCLVLFVEGQTEVEFYKALIKYIRECHVDKKLEHKVIYRSIDGIGGYKKEVNRIFLKEVKPKVEGYQITVALCYDPCLPLIRSKMEPQRLHFYCNYAGIPVFMRFVRF